MKSFHLGGNKHGVSTLLYSLKQYLNSLYENWDTHLIAVEFAYNTSFAAAIGMSPFEALYGFNPHTPLTLDAHHHLPDSKASKYLNVLRSRIDAARNHLLQHQLSQAEALN